MPRKDVARVLDAHAALEQRLHKVAPGAEEDGEHGKTCPENAGGDVGKRLGKGNETGNDL